MRREVREAIWSDDRELVMRMLRGDESAFWQFYDESAARLYRYALTRLHGDHDAAQEVVQNTFCKVFPKLRTYRGEAALFSWMCTFCRHEISAYCRQHDRRCQETTFYEESPEIRAVLDSLAALAVSPEEEVFRKEVSQYVQATLDRLPARYGNALEWKYSCGLTAEEIGRRLQITTKAAECLLARARSAFREGFAAMVGGSPVMRLGPFLRT